MDSARSLVFVSLLVSGLGLAAPRSEVHALPHGLSSPTLSGWALSDFDGDHEIDFATAGSKRSDGPGFAYDVQIELGANRLVSFTLHSLSATVQLSAQDVDGDHDRDIVILGTALLEPVGVWLNDGSGHFHEGEIAKFRDALARRNPESFKPPAPTLKLAFAVPEQRFTPAAPNVSVMAPDRLRDAFTRKPDPPVRLAERSRARPRAPPRSV